MDVTDFGPFDTVICPSCSAETHVKRHFGTYRLDRRFAVGGMSVIFAGWDTTLNRQVAIKVLNEEFCNDEVRIQAFENEARLTAQVSHPNVVKVYAVGRAYGRFYLVMELIQGKSFEQIIAKRGAIPEDEVLAIALQVGAGLRAAKNAGMIHRDVKPGNILIDETGHARLLDFGLALITQDGRAQAEEVWATPYYVPPEALERGIEDFRSDIYAFGASLYHALAGRPPFESTSTSNALLRRAKQTIPRLGKVAPWVSAPTGEVIDRMMAFNPEERWASYAQVLKALENARKGVGEHTATPIHSRKRLNRRRQPSYFGLVFVFLLVALCTGLAFWKPWEKETPIMSETPPPPPPRTVPGKLFNPGGPQNEELLPLWQKCRSLVRDGEYAEASKNFVRLSEEPTLAGMPQVWASFEAGVAASLDGEPKKARKLYTKSLKDVDRLSKQRSLQKNFREMVQPLSQVTLLSPDDFPESPERLLEWMGSFALALKQWEQGQWELALPTFAAVRGASLPDEFAWFRTYQEIADIYLADGVILTRLKNLPDPQNADEAGEQIDAIKKASSSLRTHGRAPYNLRARQDHLARVRRRFRNPPAPPEIANWEKHQATLQRSSRNLRFDDLAALLESPPPDAPPEALWAWRYLHQKAIAFTRDLASQDDWSARRKDGRSVTPISGNRNGLRLADGTLVPWNQFTLRSLLRAHADKDSHAIAFAWLAGLTREAEEKAEELAASDDQFRQDWRRVILALNP